MLHGTRVLAAIWMTAVVDGCATSTARIAPTSPSASADSGRTVVLSLTSRVFGNTRAIRVHVPAGYDDPVNAGRRYPVLYMNDGFAVFSPRLWGAPGIVDSLIRRKAIEPIILVGIDNAASIAGSTNPNRDRTNEYLPYPDPLEPDVPAPRGEQYPDFLLHEVMPRVEATFRVSTEPARTAIGGSSYGGIAALYVANKTDGRFGSLLLESTAAFLFGGRLIREAAESRTFPTSVYIGLGSMETSEPAVLAAAAGIPDKLEDVLNRRKPPPRVLFNYVEGAKHEPAAWRSRLPKALIFLFGSSLNSK
jgi:enterochelin esterase-like enzyme